MVKRCKWESLVEMARTWKRKKPDNYVQEFDAF
jgi:hypothetical protein